MKRTLSNPVIKLINKSFTGITMRNIIFRLVIGTYLIYVRNILGKPDRAILAFPNFKLFMGNGVIFSRKLPEQYFFARNRGMRHTKSFYSSSYKENIKLSILHFIYRATNKILFFFMFILNEFYRK